MNNSTAMPVAIVAALLFPRVKQELTPKDEVSNLEKSVARQQNAKKDLEKLLDRVRSGEKVSLEALFPKSEGAKGDQALLVLRQEVVSLQEELEELSQEAFALPEPEEEETEAKKAPEGPKANPLVKPDRARLGGVLFRAGKFEEALVELERAKDDPWSAFLFASCKERLGLIEDAVVAYEKVGEKFPQSSAGKQAKAVSEYLKKRNKLGKISDYDSQLVELASELLQETGETPTTPSPATTEKK